MRFSGRTLAVTAGLGLALAWAPVTALAEEAPAEQGSELQSIEVTLPNTEQSQTTTVTTPSDVSTPSEDVITDDSMTGSVSDAQEPETNLPGDGQTGETEGDPSGSLPVEGETEVDGAEGAQTDDGATSDDVTPEDGAATPGGEADPSGEGAGESGTIKLETPGLSLSQSATPTTPESAAPQSTQKGWVKEENGSYSWYGEDGKKQESGWVETDKLFNGSTSASVERFWIENGSLLISQVFDVIENGLTSWYYATEDGSIALDKYQDPTTLKIYLADAETGRLQTPNEGNWYVGTAYDDGTWQRYWIDPDTHSVTTGLFTAGGESFLGSETEGYVLRGKNFYDGKLYLSNDGGVLQKPNEGGIWYVGNAYDGGSWQRYWLNEDGSVRTGVFQLGSDWFYAGETEGYVLRGKNKYEGRFYLSDDGGVLQTPNEGGVWYVGNAYDGGSWQRYWLEFNDNDGWYAKPGLIEFGNQHFIASSTEGYVLRGKAKDGNKLYLADDGGVLQEPNEGSFWYVGGDYDGGTFQRYYINDDYSVKTGFFGIGSSYYYAPSDKGYVVRGKYVYNSSNMLLADNGGILFNDASVRNMIEATKEETKQSVSYNGVFYKLSTYDNGTTKKYYFRFLSGTDLDGNGTPVIAAGIGFIELDGGKTEYYGSTTEGYIMTGTFTTPTGIMVTTDADGKVTAKGTSVVFEALRRLNASYSDTNWAICVDVHAHEVMVFNRASKNSAWTLARQFKCGTGNTAAGTPTFRGELTLGGGWSPSANKYLPADDRIYKYDYFGAWYYMPYYLDQGFHSVIDGDMDGYVSPSDTASQVGKDISHGCIRCPMDDLKWVWENVPDGSRVIIYPYSTNGVYYRAGF